MRSNCLIWALSAYRAHYAQWVECGSIHGREPMMRARSSRMAPRWVPHAQVEYWHGGEWVVEQFVPDDSRPVRWWQIWRCLWFRGHVKRGDFPDIERVT